MGVTFFISLIIAIIIAVCIRQRRLRLAQLNALQRQQQQHGFAVPQFYSGYPQYPQNAPNPIYSQNNLPPPTYPPTYNEVTSGPKF